jgi:cobalt/nickel transport protein
MKWWHYLLGISLLMAVVLSVFASSDPDGLERVAEDLGFIESAEDSPVNSPVPDYEVPGIGGTWLATSLAGFLGVAAVFVMLFLIGKILKK